jgi:hypothetical protein
MRPRLQRVACVLATSLLISSAGAASSDAIHAKNSAQRSLMNKLRECLNVDGAKAVSAAVVSSCPKRNVERLVGISRDDLFSALGKPVGCGHADRTRETWNDGRCADAVDVYYFFWPPCELGRGPAYRLDIGLDAAGGVITSRWQTGAEAAVWVGPVTCVP